MARGPELVLLALDERDLLLQLGVPPDGRSSERQLAVHEGLGGLVDVATVADDAVIAAGDSMRFSVGDPVSVRPV